MLANLMITTLAALPLLVRAEDLLVFEKTAPTVYYDNLWRENGDPCVPLWAPGGSDSQLAESLCESDFTSPKEMDKYKSNQIVAIDRRYLEGRDEQGMENRKKFCGKQVKVYKPDGTEYISAGGDMFIWDGCLECKELGGHKVDFSGPDFLAMTGLGTGQCGVGVAEFRVVVTDKQVVEPDASPPDAPGGLKTFPNSNTGGTTFGAPANQIAYFESIRVKAPERTDYGWLGHTPAGTDNYMGKGPGSGSDGYVDSGPHPEMPSRGKAPESWTAAQLTGLGGGNDTSSAGSSGGGSSVGGGGEDGSTGGASASNFASLPPASSGGASGFATPSSPAVSPAATSVNSNSPAPSAPISGSFTGASGAGISAGGAGSAIPPAAVNFVAGGKTATAASGSGSASGSSAAATGGVQPAASGVANISGGNCVAGNWRCNGAVVEVCAEGNDQSVAWVGRVPCPNGCVETQPGVPGCL